MQNTSTSPFLRWLPPVLWGLVILVLSLMPGGPGNMNLFGIPHFDKVGHFGMYAVWTFLIFRSISFNPNRTANQWLWISILVGASMGVILEIGQLTMHQGRSFELADMLANALVAGVGAWIGKLYFTRK
ncbi:MAG TPA: VanZ family protein [Saprospiraceae bacterium]